MHLLLLISIIGFAKGANPCAGCDCCSSCTSSVQSVACPLICLQQCQTIQSPSCTTPPCIPEPACPCKDKTDPPPTESTTIPSTLPPTTTEASTTVATTLPPKGGCEKKCPCDGDSSSACSCQCTNGGGCDNGNDCDCCENECQKSCAGTHVEVYNKFETAAKSSSIHCIFSSIVFIGITRLL